MVHTGKTTREGIVHMSKTTPNKWMLIIWARELSVNKSSWN